MITLRRARPADVDQIVRLSNAGGPDGNPKKHLPDPLPSGYHEAFLRIDQDPNQHLMVATIDDTIVGTFHLSFLTYLEGAGQYDCQIESIHVSKAWQNQGIGTQMMAWAINTANERSCRRLQLTSNKHRKAAHRFYERMGFSLSHEGAKMYLG